MTTNLNKMPWRLYDKGTVERYISCKEVRRDTLNAEAWKGVAESGTRVSLSLDVK